MSERLFELVRLVWWFSGESPQLFDSNYRLAEVTAAVGLAQPEKLDRLIGGAHSRTPIVLKEANDGCGEDDPQLAGKRRAGSRWPYLPTALHLG